MYSLGRRQVRSNTTSLNTTEQNGFGNFFELEHFSELLQEQPIIYKQQWTNRKTLQSKHRLLLPLLALAVAADCSSSSLISSSAHTASNQQQFHEYTFQSVFSSIRNRTRNHLRIAHLHNQWLRPTNDISYCSRQKTVIVSTSTEFVTVPDNLWVSVKKPCTTGEIILGQVPNTICAAGCLDVNDTQ